MDAWCIITICGLSSFTVDTQAILQRGSGFLRDCLGGTELEVAQATWLVHTMGKGIFDIIHFAVIL